ncbi:MAG: CBS domain-containing protein [Nitrospinota bacterium]|nr:MAG: CBS domain-containing protein [Nitrospinota bacterium]
MLVRERMTVNPITVHPETPFPDALQLMRTNRIRRLPVVDQQGNLVGIITERDLLYASPSPATSLSVWELNYLLAKLEVQEIMKTEVITISPDTPIEEAARIIVDHKIGSLPVIDQYNHLIGIITETDIFKAFVSFLGGGQRGTRLTVKAPERKGVLTELVTTVEQLGGEIVSVGSFAGRDSDEREFVIKVRGVEAAALVQSLERLGDQIIDVREI